MRRKRSDRPTMSAARTNPWEFLATADQLDELHRLARERRWGLAFIAVAWLHLLAFLLCNHMSATEHYHAAAGYLGVWVSELLCVGLIFALCAGPRRNRTSLTPLARFVIRVWVAYFVLAFNLGTMNTLRGNEMFELLPAMASLGSFAFLVMTFAVHRWFFAAVLVMFAAGLLMAAYLLHAYLVFAWAWWLVLNGIGISLVWKEKPSRATRVPLMHKPGEPARS